MELIDKNKIEEILRNLWKKDDGHNAEHRICYNKALQEVQCELDTLEVKEVDLDFIAIAMPSDSSIWVNHDDLSNLEDGDNIEILITKK